MRVGAHILMDQHGNDKDKVAEAYVRGDIFNANVPYLFDVITQKDIEAAKNRIPIEEWNLELRVERLEGLIK
jgi:hypothetical protein